MTARVLLVVVALAVAATASAETQRWEYASLWMAASSTVMYEDTETFLSTGVVGGPSRMELGEELVRMFGRPPNLRMGLTYTEMNLLNILGYGGWELVSTVTNKDGDRIHFFKRRR